MKTTVTIAVAAATFALGATAGGVAVATSKAAPSVKACETSHGVLTLASHSGGCPSHTRKVTIAKKGPRGARGANGKPGAAGPGAQSSSAVSTTAAKDTGNAIVVPGTKLTISAECSSGEDDTASVDLFGPGSFTVLGNEQSNVSNATAREFYNLATGDPQHAGLDATGLPSFTSSSTDEGADAGIIISSTNGGGGVLSGSVLVTDAGHTFSLAIDLLASISSCSATAQVIPST